MEKVSVARAIAEQVLDPVLQQNVKTMVITIQPKTPTGSTAKPGTIPSRRHDLDSVVHSAVTEYPRRFHNPAEGVQLTPRANPVVGGMYYDNLLFLKYSFDVSKTFPSFGHLSMRRAFSVFGIDFIREVDRALKTSSFLTPEGYPVEVGGYTFISDKKDNPDSIKIHMGREIDSKNIKEIHLFGNTDGLDKAIYSVKFPDNTNIRHAAQVEAYGSLGGDRRLRVWDAMEADPSDPDTVLGKQYKARVTQNVDNTPIWALLSVLLKEMDRRSARPQVEIRPNPARPWHLRGPFVDMAV